MTPTLKKLYKEFLDYDREIYLQNVKWWLGANSLKLTKNQLKKLYSHHQKISFFYFLKNLKIILFSKNPFEIIYKNSQTIWDLWVFLSFLKKKRIADFKQNKIYLKMKKILDEFVPLLSEKEIKNTLEKKLKKKVSASEPVISLFEDISKKFSPSHRFDQAPISQKSVIFLIKKITEWLPKNENFLLVGDDDFVSLFLALLFPKLKISVVDKDKRILSFIQDFSKKFKLKIKVYQRDILNLKKLPSGPFWGFSTNPPDTWEGTEKFFEFGKRQLSKKGGVAFLIIDVAEIGSDILGLEKYFLKKNFAIKEILPGIFYPFYQTNLKEDEITQKQLKKFFSKKFIEKNPKIGSSLFILEYAPFWAKKIKLKGKTIYSYF